MSVCVRCFFENAYQLKLKKRAFGSPKFEDTLVNYKKIFMEEIDSLVEVEECECCTKKEYSFDYIIFLNKFLKDIQLKRDYIEGILDDIIDVYMGYIIEGREYALCNMKKFLKNHCTNDTIDGAMKFCEPMFRVRTKGNYDTQDINELYHVPFDKRYLTRNRRFSLSGQTMLYTAESLLTALKEVETTIGNSSVAVYIPKYSHFCKETIYNITNRIIEHLKSDCVEKNEEHAIAESILFQILQFPVQKNYSGTFVQEYVLPQLVMEILNQRKYCGVIYQTTKEIDWVNPSINGSYPDTNYCFFIPYKKDSKYNDEFLDKFFVATWSEKQPLVSYSRLYETLEQYKLGDYLVSDYTCCVDKIEKHVEKMIQCMGKKSYTTSRVGKIEMTLLYHLLKQL